MLNFDLINKRLKEHPRLLQALGEITKEKSTSKLVYPNNEKLGSIYTIYGILNSSEDDYQSFRHKLIKLNDLSDKLSNLYSKEDIKKGVCNDFFSFLVEIEFANFCCDKNIEIIEKNPVLNTGNRLDFKIKIGSIVSLIEVIKPMMKQEMLEKEVGSFSLSGELEENFYYEFNTHKILDNEIKEPFIIVLNKDYSSRDEYVDEAIENFKKKYEKEANILTGILLIENEKCAFFECNDKLTDSEKKIIEESLK